MLIDLYLHCMYVSRSERALFTARQICYTDEAAETRGKRAKDQEIAFGIICEIKNTDKPDQLRLHFNSEWSSLWVNIGTA